VSSRLDGNPMSEAHERSWTTPIIQILLLFRPDDQLVHCDLLGSELRALTSAIISRRVQEPFLGYLPAQEQRLNG